MGTSWNQYTGVYYGIQVSSLFTVIPFVLIILIPYDLIGWILKTIFCMEDNKTKRKTEDVNETKPETEDVNKTKPETEDVDETKPETEDVNKTKPETEDRKIDVEGCICSVIWDNLHEWSDWESCQGRTCCEALKRIWNWVEQCYDSSFRCNKVEDLHDRWLPHKQNVKLEEKHARWYCGSLMHINMNRIAVYGLLCTCIWCAFVAFFEAVILGYTIVVNGNTACPTPKRASDKTIVDCFAYTHSFDTTPANKTYPNQCNSTSRLTFNGAWAGCYTWIYADVAVVDVIEQLGICSGIIAFIGSTVAIMSYLCRYHQWRLFFDILAGLAIAAIPIFIEKIGSLPLLTYSLLISLFISIAITEYLLQCIPFLTAICVVNIMYKRIKERFGSIENDHNLEV